MLHKIGNYNVEHIKQFFYDGCHKIYLIEDDNDIQTMLNEGWALADIYPIEQLEYIYQNSCPLKFINNVKLTKTYAKQGQKQLSFTYDSYISKIKKEI